MCDFLAANLALCAKLLNAACDTNYTEDDMKTMGKRIWTLARLFNVRDGFSKKDDIMPPRMYLDPLPEGNAKGKVVTQQDFDKMLTDYYRFWGWDEQGKPTQSGIQEVGLANLAAR